MDGSIIAPKIAGPGSVKSKRLRAAAPKPRLVFPFSAIVGQEELKLSLSLCAVDPAIGGVLALGDRGTGKSTAIRALAALLPPMQAIQGCRYNCEPGKPTVGCEICARRRTESVSVSVPVVDLPLGASEDRVVGALDLEKALTQGQKAFEPGLLARAHRGFLYIDEVNLLEDHLVDLLLDVAASGENVVERDGLSVRHPARFVLVGSGNPEEGELRPQLLDRFGLSVEVLTPKDLPTRMQVIRRRDNFERDPPAFCDTWQPEEEALRARILAGRALLPKIAMPDELLEMAAKLCITAGTDGLRGELTLMRTARALAAFEGAEEATLEHLRRLAPLALRHRLRRNPLDDSVATTRVARAVEEVFGP